MQQHGTRKAVGHSSVHSRPRLTSTAALIIVLFVGCSGPQSALEPAGRGAEDLAHLFWWMTAGAVVIWAVVLVLLMHAVRVHPERGERMGSALIVGCGVIAPTIILAILLIFGLRLMPRLLAPAPEGSLRIAVSGEQWWWRVRYELPDQTHLELANEIRLPVGEPVEFVLESPDVIHSFWIPALGGKMDMIPGRRTRLVLEPTRTGVFRGACAEYCGASHALMAFPAVVMEREKFDRWLDQQRRPASESGQETARAGRQVFFSSGCPACHTVRGTSASGSVGPDLTHVGSRMTIGAGMLPMRHESLVRWIQRTEELKPGVHMPSFRMLSNKELEQLASYLGSLQ